WSQFLHLGADEDAETGEDHLGNACCTKVSRHHAIFCKTLRKTTADHHWPSGEKSERYPSLKSFLCLCVSMTMPAPRKRESPHAVSGCKTSRTRLHYLI